MKTAKTICIWIIGILFIAAGISKFFNLDPVSIELFSRAHYPFWLYFIAAALEFFGGLLILMGPTRRYGFMMISVVMIGAVCTHLYLRDSFSHCIVPLAIIILSYFIVVRSKEK